MSETADPYDSAERHCDIVMKGGITSGVVYPSAVCELAQAFRFRNIGGTSAGAIAAAATAAAEYGRREGRGTGFAGLADLPRRLAEELPEGESRLQSLFQPGDETRPLFRVLIAAIGTARPGRKIVRTARAALSAFPEGAWLGALAGLLPSFALLAALPGADSLAGRAGYTGALLCTLAVAGLGALLGAAMALVSRACAAIPAHDFGLCRGYDLARNDPAHPRGAPPLTEWLTGLFDELAGKRPEEGPLTFGDLEPDRDQEGAIHLEVMTSCVTLGRPFRLPLDSGLFYFRRRDLERFFPPRVVEWMVSHPRQGGGETPEALLQVDGEPLHPLPAPADLPVVVAVRMSLSFPLLISAVPLWAIDWSRADDGDDGDEAGERQAAPRPERCWFSDGGLASNLPIHFFDAPLPRWPAVAIDLVEGLPLSDDEAENVILPRTNSAGLLSSWTRFGSSWGGGQLVSFLLSLINVMQNWRDETQTKMPGYRDRIAHILLGKREGGINLGMERDTLERLTRRGYWAGFKLKERFAGPAPPGELSWDNHRWVRYRSAMDAMQEMLFELRAAYDERRPGERSYEELILRAEGVEPRSYPLRSESRKERFAVMTRELMDFARKLEADPTFDEARPPRPRGELRIVPRV